MNDLGIIDRFTNVFSAYIDSGFGLLGGEVAFLTAAMIAIDMALAGVFWAMAGEDVLPKLLRKTLYVGAFAFILNNFKELADVVFNSFAGLGLVASDSTLTAADLLRPGRLAAVGVDAARPILSQIGDLAGFPDFFLNFDSFMILSLAWLVVILSFFVLAVQLFVAIIEFKLTTLAGFVLVPFALWNKTSFLAERVLGNVVSSGIKILVLAVIVGIGTVLFDEMIAAADAELTINDALATMLASLAMFALGLFGPGIANGLVAGAPQLGAETAAGAALAAGGAAVVGGKAIAGTVQAASAIGGAAVGAAGKVASAAAPVASAGYKSFKTGMNASGAGGAGAVASGIANVARDGGRAISDGARSVANRAEGAIRQRLGLSARGSAAAAKADEVAAPPVSPAAAESPPNLEVQQMQAADKPAWASRAHVAAAMMRHRAADAPASRWTHESGGVPERTSGEDGPSD